MKKKQCLNCGNYFEGEYCNACGQSIETHRLDLHFIWHDIQHGLFHFDSGILYSFKELFLRPGHSIREYIAGKRMKHFKPISLVIILAVFYGLVYHNFGIDTIKPFVKVKSDLIDYHAYNEWFATHFSWITLAGIPFYTLGTIIFFRHKGYNAAEYFVLNTFKASQRLFLHIATIPLLIICKEPEHLKSIIFFLYLVDLAMGIITNIQFFNTVPRTKVLLLSLLSHLVFLAVILIVASLIVYFILI